MKLAEIFTNGMVVQAGKPFRVFGTGAGSGTVTWQSVTQAIDTKEDRWCLTFDAPDYGGPYTLEATLAGEKTVIQDVMVGEVLLFSGQSNIQFHMADEVTPVNAYRKDNLLRIFVPERMEAGESLFPKDGWVNASPENIDGWSALAYLTGCEMRNAGCPAVGVIACSQGASVIQSWIPQNKLVDTDLDIPAEQLFADHQYPQYQRWNGYGTLYDFMISRLFPLSLGAVVWYQGESNRSPAEGALYDRMLTLLIDTWRESFQAPSLPFIVVQLADFDAAEPIGWRLVQEKQMAVEKMRAYVRTVPCADICESDNIHPPTKGLLAKRIRDTLAEDKLLPYFQ